MLNDILETRVPGTESPATPSQDLDAELRRLHGGPDAAALARLHEQAAAALGEPGAVRFHLTHAWIYALVCADNARVASLEARLRALGGLR